MSKKTTTKSNSVTTPTNPEWSTSANKGLSEQIAAIGKTDPGQYVAPAGELLTQAGGNAGQLGGDTDTLRSLLGQRGAININPASLLEGFNNYQNPHTENVVQNALRGFDENAASQMAQQDLEQARGSNFDSGGAIGDVLLRRGQGQDRATLDSGLRSDGFNTAAQLSNLDADRRQGASMASAQLASQDLNSRIQGLLGAADSTRADIGTQAGIGDALRQVDSQQRMAPLSLLQAQAGLNSQVPYNLFTGQTQTGTSTSKTSDPLGTLGSLAMGAGSLFAAPLTGGLSLGALGGGATLGGLFGGGAKALGAWKAASGMARA